MTKFSTGQASIIYICRQTFQITPIEGHFQFCPYCVFMLETVRNNSQPCKVFQYDINAI